MTNKKLSMGLIATSIALALSSGAIASEQESEFDQDLRLRFHNELRDSNQYGYNDNSLADNTPNL